MKYLYIIEKGQEVFSKIKKVEEVVTDKNNTAKQYKDDKGEIQSAYPTKVFCYETEKEAREKIEELVDKEIEVEKNKLIEAFSKLETKKNDILKSIEVVEVRAILPFEKKLNENDLYLAKKGDEYELYVGKDKSVVFLMDCESSEDLQEVLIKECDYHLEMIETEDEDYFDDCDEAYLKGDWKNLVLKIQKIVQTTNK